MRKKSHDFSELNRAKQADSPYSKKSKKRNKSTNKKT